MTSTVATATPSTTTSTQSTTSNVSTVIPPSTASTQDTGSNGATATPPTTTSTQNTTSNAATASQPSSIFLKAKSGISKWLGDILSNTGDMYTKNAHKANSKESILGKKENEVHNIHGTTEAQLEQKIGSKKETMVEKVVVVVNTSVGHEVANKKGLNELLTWDFEEELKNCNGLKPKTLQEAVLADPTAYSRRKAIKKKAEEACTNAVKAYGKVAKRSANRALVSLTASRVKNI
jgi:hypothetical protein